MDYLFNLFLISVRPLGLIVALVALSYLLPVFLHRGSGNPAYVKFAKWRWKVAGVLILLVLLFKATSPSITPQNSTKPQTTVTVPVEVPPQEIVSTLKQAKHTDEERQERFDKLTDWRKSNGTKPAE